MKAIQKYWEYALLSKMLEQKKRELERTVSISDQELDGYAEKMCYRLKYRTSSFKVRAEADAFAALCSSRKGTLPADEVGVSACEGMSPASADEYFQMGAGDIKVIKKGGEFVVVKMLSKEKTLSPSDLPPREELRKYALAMKRARALEDWTVSVVKEAKVVKYNNNNTVAK